jgi:hypothetical protein
MQIRDTGSLYAAIGALVIIAAVNSCTSDNIRSDYDPAANFSHYRTYDFFPGAGPDDTAYESVFTEHMVEAISIEMDKRGYVRSSDPDLLINFNAILREKSKVISSPPPLVGGYYGYRSGYYDPWLGYGYTQQSYVLHYTEGTFMILSMRAGSASSGRPWGRARSARRISRNWTIGFMKACPDISTSIRLLLAQGSRAAHKLRQYPRGA